jgi:formyl-CoA transferase/CoA:oxalate CoA-transferase
MIAEDVPVGPVNTLEEVMQDPQVLHNESVFELEHPTVGRIRQAKPAARFDATPTQVRRPPPLHGEHTEEVLAELGYDAAARQRLAAEGAVVLPVPPES